jgi:cyclopropane fatty-acyl-phospholipid synthase-like methyltransferase
MDGSAEGFKKLALLEKERDVSIKKEVADLAHYSMGEAQWDGIVSIWCHLPKAIWKGVLSKVTQALKPGGVFLLESYTPEQLKYGTGGPSEVDFMATLEELKDVFKGFKIVNGQEIVREIHEGKAHNGLSAVVQFVAVRV